MLVLTIGDLRVSIEEPPGTPGVSASASGIPRRVGGPTRVVVVDDDPMVREAVRALMEDRGFDVVGEAEDGLAAVGVVAELLPDVVLMDVKMPVMDGLEATRRITTAHPTVKVILLSAYDDASFRRTADQIGAADYLVKGVSPLVLEQAIRNAGDRAVRDESRPEGEPGV